MPPELLERARVSAERDAKTQEKLQARQDRYRGRGRLGAPPGGRHRALAAAWAVLSLLGLAAGVAGSFATAELGRADPLGAALGLLRVAATAALLLVALSSLPPKKYRAALLALLAAGVLLTFAQSFVGTLRSPSENAPLPPAANAIGGALFATLFSAQPWLLLGAARRRSTERLAALLLGISMGLFLFVILAQPLIRLANPGKELEVTPWDFVGMSHQLFLFLLLLSWPVVSRPLRGKAEES
jgi:hypothetical protein